ncbi:unnamed protein product [Owenia fusiformis]|uniref:Inhibitor of growth protein n=1 Tax=Owenia fusiformis TaxID=6347 RepID=A0A8J1THY8_OWEFU|nr:unnamed protein product [Owenia fusiformis]
MSMLNQAAVEALCSATYLENYLDCLETLPEDLQRSISQLREMDAQTNVYLNEMEHQRDIHQKTESDVSIKKQALIKIQRALIKCQELGDEKLQIVSSIIEFVENRTRQLDGDLENLDPSIASHRQDFSGHDREISVTANLPTRQISVKNTHKDKHDKVTNEHSTKEKELKQKEKEKEREKEEPPPAIVKQEKEDKNEKTDKGVKRQRRQRQHLDSTTSKEEIIEKREKDEKPKKKKKRKTTKKEEKGQSSPADIPIDPDEPTYCLCEQVSYGEMIGCDNDACEIEWFHFNCVQLSTKPKGKWYCPQCRGEKSNIMKKFT